jgi:hypothetical protein
MNDNPEANLVKFTKASLEMQRIIRFATLDSLLDFVFLKLLRSSYQIDSLLSVKKNRLCGAVILFGSKSLRLEEPR